MNSKVCPICRDAFIPKSSRQKYCKKEIELTCPICGDRYTGSCQPENPTTCTKPECKKKAAQLGAQKMVKKCRVCGQEFHPESTRQLDCNRPIKRICVVCGKEFEAKCSMNDTNKTCSPECLHKYAHQMSEEAYKKETRICELCGKAFHLRTNTQKYCEDTHYRTCVICGKEFPIDTSKVKTDWPETCSEECANKLRGERNGMKRPEVQQKFQDNYRAKTGYDHPMKNPEVIEKFWASYENKTGYKHPQYNPAVRKQSNRTRSLPNTEKRVCNILENYHIQYEHGFIISKGGKSHEFDFYLPDYNLLIDCDGIFYHSYLDDPDGKHVLDYYDEDRIFLVPEDCRLHVIVEGNEEHDIKELMNILTAGKDFTHYDSELFKWCKSIGFPYPVYQESRLQKEWEKLCNWSVDKYNPAARKGDCIIKQFHRSIWSSRVRNYASPIEAWNDDGLLKKVIANRLIYKNDVDPSKILAGFNISKICPRVSIFNPLLARYITLKYLNEFNEVFDPFSGFSGRLLGVASTGKKYIGQDLNELAVNESNEIVRFLNLPNADIITKDIEESSGTYECLFTCPPYGKKETYSSETIFKTCDDWITDVLTRFDCQRYVFVVDETSRYQDFIKEEIKSTSHFVNFTEKLIVINKGDGGTSVWIH